MKFPILLICISISGNISFGQKIDSIPKNTTRSVTRDHRLKRNDRSYVLVNPIVSEENSFIDSLNIIIPIGTFILGLIIPPIINSQIERKSVKAYLQRWKAEIQALKNPMKNQIISLRKFVDDQNSETYTIPNPTIYTALSAVSFQSLDKGKLLDAIQKTMTTTGEQKLADAMKICNSTLSYIEIVAALDINFKEKMRDFLGNTSELFKNFNESLRQVTLNFRELGIEIEKKNGSINAEQPYVHLNELMHLYMDVDTQTDIFILEKTFFKGVDAILPALRQYDTCKSLYEENHACITYIKHIREERRIFNHHVEITIQKYRQLLEEVDEITSFSKAVDEDKPVLL